MHQPKKVLPYVTLGVIDVQENSNRRGLILPKFNCYSAYFSVTIRGTKWSDIDLGDLVNIKNEDKELVAITRVVGLMIAPHYIASLVSTTDWQIVDRVLDNDVTLSINKIRLITARRVANFYGKLEEDMLFTVLFLGVERYIDERT